MPRFSHLRRMPLRLPRRQAGQKLRVAFGIAALASLIAFAWWRTQLISDPLVRLDDLLYDFVYRTRTPEDRRAGNVVIVAIDEDSIDKLTDKKLEDVVIPWPWPRELYGDMVQYFERCGAKVVAFDMVFSDPGRQSEQLSDETFAELMGQTKIPTVFGTLVNRDGTLSRFAPPVKNPVFGAINSEGGILRVFSPFWNGYPDGYPSLAYRAVTLYSGHEPERKLAFRTHFYGPHRNRDGTTTFRYVSAFNVLAASRGAPGLDPNIFRDKIVLVGGTALGTYDDKTIPLPNEDPELPATARNIYPGVEWQATAVENILFQQRVRMIQPPVVGLVTFIGALMAAAGSMLPSRVALKLCAGVTTAALMFGFGVVLFRGHTIRWLPLAAPMLAIFIATVGALAWSYFTEGRARLFIAKAFALSTSPLIEEAIRKNPEKLKLGGERREITVMFTDLAGFTDLAETMEVVNLAKVINTYMEAMSEEIVQRDGYLDKYIGDAIMSFWNGLIDQPDHAARACRAALAIKRREVEIAPELQKLVEAKIITRIGINTGPMAVGNLGSSRKFSYTVLGDAVNLGARLEPANKLYDTEVMVSHSVAQQVKGEFALRELDLLAVKGKTIPMPVYELMAENPPSEDTFWRIEGYAAALAHYRAQRWEQAEAAFNAVLASFPDDGPSAKMLKRIPALREAGLPANWDGVYRAKEK